MEERRAAPRVTMRPEVEATIGEIAVRIVELSAVGARIEHEDRFPLTSPELQVKWQGSSVALPIKVIRSEIVGRRASGLVYSTGIKFTGDALTAQAVISALIDTHADAAGGDSPPAGERTPEAAAAAPDRLPQPRAPRPSRPDPQLDDTWTRQVRFLDHDPEDELPYAQFRRTPEGWKKSYTASPVQPEDGFTIPRDQRDFAELQHTFDCADPETRRMMQIALEAQLHAKA